MNWFAEMVDSKCRNRDFSLWNISTKLLECSARAKTDKARDLLDALWNHAMEERENRW